jgi:hypothetical protein
VPSANAAPTARRAATRQPTLRPGELREPVRLTATDARRLAAAAAGIGLASEAAFGLLFEATLVRADLRQAGADESCITFRDGAPAVLSAAEADYLRALTVGRGRAPRRKPSKGPGVFPLPVRLMSRCSRELIDEALAGDAEQALSWETRAVREGRTMLEWALSRALLARA